MLERRDYYQAMFNERIASLQGLLSETADPIGKYNITIAIADNYQANNYDSTIYYLQQARSIAIKLNDSYKITKSDILLAREHVRGGYFPEASSIIDLYAAKNIPDELFCDWNMLLYSYYYTLGGTSQIDEINDHYSFLVDSLAGVLLNDKRCEGNEISHSAQFYNLNLVRARYKGDYAAADSLGEMFLSLFNPGTKDYAYMAWSHALDVTNPTKKASLFAASYMSDISCANRDCASLEAILNILSDYKNPERSFKYLSYCMIDATDFNGRYRSVAASRAFPRIEQYYHESSDRLFGQIKKMLIILAILSTALIVILVILAKRQRTLINTRKRLQDSLSRIERQNAELSDANEKLNELNVRIQHADRVKQDYVAMFLSMLSDNLSTSRKYHNHVRNMIKQGSADKLLKEISSDDQQGVDEFYKMFDQAFVNMFPDFVEQFNGLLQEEYRIVPKANELLTPELRVFALIKMGVRDSSKIAALLHYSANTIYNYRSKVKNAALCNREEFEDKVRQL